MNHQLKNLVAEKALIKSLMILFIFSLANVCAQEYNSNCFFSIHDDEVKHAIQLKEKTFSEIQFDQLRKNSVQPEEKPCTLYLYNLANTSDNIWYKFYCSILADENGYTDFAKSLQVKLLFDNKITTIEHILMGVEFARLNKTNSMKKQFEQAAKKLSSCNIVQEYIWLNDDIYFINNLINLSPTDFNEINRLEILKFYTFVTSTLLLFPNFNGKSIVMTFLNELLLRNSEYKLSKEFRDLTLAYATSVGVNNVDAYELSIAHIMGKWIIFVLIFIIPLYLICIISAIIKSRLELRLFRRTIYLFVIIIVIIALGIIENQRLSAALSFLKKAPIDFKTGLRKSTQTLAALNRLYNTDIPESIFLLALYHHINKDYYTAYETYISALSSKKLDSELKAKILNNLGAIAIESGEIQEAKAYFKMALNLNKNFSPSLYNLYLINKDINLLSDAQKIDKIKIDYLTNFSPNKPYIALLNYKELIRVFSKSPDYFSSIKNMLESGRKDIYIFILELELLLGLFILVILYILFSYRKYSQIPDDSQSPKNNFLYKFINLTIPGYFLISQGWIVLGTIFMFSFYIGLALFYKIIIDNSFIMHISDFSRAWFIFMEKHNFHTSALISPMLYSVSLYLLFLSLFLSVLITVIGMTMKKK